MYLGRPGAYPAPLPPARSRSRPPASKTTKTEKMMKMEKMMKTKKIAKIGNGVKIETKMKMGNENGSGKPGNRETK